MKSIMGNKGRSALTMLGIIIGIVLVAAIIGFIIGAAKCWENDARGGQIACTILAIVCAISFIVVPFSVHTINSGELAVVKRFGKVVGVADPGTNFDIWFTHFILILFYSIQLKPS